MGKKYDSKLASGTRGSAKIRYPRSLYPGVSVTAEDIEYLMDLGVKFNEEEVIFVLHNSPGFPIWLEIGNRGSGLLHLKEKSSNQTNKGAGQSHQEQLINCFNVAMDEIPKLMHDIIAYGTFIRWQSNLNGPAIVYNYRGKDVLVAYGNNGYIVTVYPL